MPILATQIKVHATYLLRNTGLDGWSRQLIGLIKYIMSISLKNSVRLREKVTKTISGSLIVKRFPLIINDATIDDVERHSKTHPMVGFAERSR